jgi:membrane protein YqaA with SNARE-associated domain
MRLFSSLYDWTLALARHRYAERYLAALSFAESSFFPIPPDVMLAPMTLAAPQRGLRFAAVTTFASVLGGAAGYLIGFLALDLIIPLLERFGYMGVYARANAWFDEWGFFAILAAGFSPIPYKIFTIAAGALRMFFPGFIVASVLGRGARFFLVAGLIMFGGPRMAAGLRRYIDAIGWAVVALIVLAILAWRWF